MTNTVILCVDDELIVLKSLQRELNQAFHDSYLIEIAQSGADALDIFNELSEEGYTIPVVLSDHIMPEMKGDEFLIRLHEIAPKTLKILLTGQADIAAVTNAVNHANLYQYISKHWEPTHLRLTITEAIRKYEQNEQLEEQNRLLKDMNVILEQQVKERTAELEAQKIELQQKNAQLRDANSGKDKFFSIISHDLRSPFSTLLGYAQRMTDSADALTKEQIVEYAFKLRAIAERSNGLLENLLSWARMQRGAMEYTPERFDLHDIALDISDLFFPKAEQKGIRLHSAIPPQTPAYADYSMITTVLRNLVSNALKFTSAGGEIQMSARRDGDAVEVAVTDTGAGMSEEGLSKIFRLDAQYTQTGTHGETGTGLGLLLCKEFVEKNHGRIWVESELGKGSAFKFTLPVQP